MGKVRHSMPLYEHVFMVRQDASTAQVETLTQQFKTVIESMGGTIPKTEYWGVKTLSFRIRKNRKAHYTLMNIDAPAAAVNEMERQMSINEDVIRILTLRVDAHEEGPSAVLRFSRGRDERGDRGDRGDRGFDRGGGFGRDRDRAPRDPSRPPRDRAPGSEMREGA